MQLAEFDRPINTLIRQALHEDEMPRPRRTKPGTDPQAAEEARLIQLAKAKGLDMSPPKVTPEQIIQAALAPPAATLRITNDTTDQEISDVIRGRRRA